MNDHEHHTALDAAGRFAAELNEAMERMMREMHGPAPIGDPDQDFLAMMIPHHQGAIDMARAVLEHGRDPLTRDLAHAVIATQAMEIRSMRARLDQLQSTTAPDFPALTGTRGY